VATHASALKAHRQSLVHRERNRKYRSQLRSTLKQIRALLDDPKHAKNQAEAKKELTQAISLIDRMAGKGIIHRNTAGRYKSRLNARVAAKAAS
jgi:small subunit ribosomal protein S20